jgi:hypothetical protein
MRYAEGARLFYRALAEGLLIEVGVQSSVQLVVPENVSPPEEDCLALARTMAARHQESLTDPLQFDGTSVDPASLPSRPLVLDCRHLDPEILVTRFRPHFESRADVVVLVTAEVHCSAVALYHSIGTAKVYLMRSPRHLSNLYAKSAFAVRRSRCLPAF